MKETVFSDSENESSLLDEKIIIIEDELQDNLSSTFIRKRLLAGDDVKYLVPDEVNDYLIKKQVYTEESLKINTDVVLAPLSRGD